jgi:hypothetical protein
MEHSTLVQELSTAAIDGHTTAEQSHRVVELVKIPDVRFRFRGFEGVR